MDNLPLPEEFDDIVDIRVVGKPENVVVGHPRLLLWYVNFLDYKYSRLFGTNPI